MFGRFLLDRPFSLLRLKGDLEKLCKIVRFNNLRTFRLSFISSVFALYPLRLVRLMVACPKRSNQGGMFNQAWTSHDDESQLGNDRLSLSDRQILNIVAVCMVELGVLVQ